jgi:hypothetical protein
MSDSLTEAYIFSVQKKVMLITPSADVPACRKAGDGDRTHDVELGKLAFYH